EYTKDENVYVRMDTEGEVAGTYVVNTFTVTDAGEITDHGHYETIKNLTNLDSIEEDKEDYTFTAEKGKFYYQGDIVNATLPWNFDISYVLDDKDVDATELAGAEGDLEIHLKIDATTDEEVAKFLPAYLLQVKFTLDNNLCEDIVADGATIIDTGSKETLSYNIMGDSAEIVITTTVHDFEMDDISITGAPVSDFPVSFVSTDNENVRQTMFLMSAEGVEIPEVEVVEEVEEEEGNFFKQMVDRFVNRSIE
ncbi:MAG: hypothetical protein K6F66_08125, partial [Pseudobutyrivibrio sp.]|nr:hypothetical protein [Pseudobutyrivibrio sp.]